MGNNSILSQFGNSIQSGGNNMGTVIDKYGSLDNAVKSLSGMLGKKNVNPKQLAINSLNGKTFSEVEINKFKGMAASIGISEEQVDRTLKEIGIIK